VIQCAGSEIRIGRGLIESLTVENAVILTQPGAEAIARSVTARTGAPLLVLPDGEETKTLQIAERTYRWLDECDVDRSGRVVAIGGGTVTDLAGFVASTYMRGIRLTNVPTTLLGAVDAAIGGKTAVNLAAKNMVGTFWAADSVVVDLDVLEDLPPPLITEGMAEIAKAGLIGDPHLVARLERYRTGESLEHIVHDAVAVKARIVNDDPREAGPRAFLNYGHTSGHAIERVSGIGHGAAVSVGMTIAARLSSRLLGFEGAQRQESLLSHLGLPTRHECAVEPVMDLLRSDKKRRLGETNMVLLEEVGAPKLVAVEEADLRWVLSDTLS